MFEIIPIEQLEKSAGHICFITRGLIDYEFFENNGIICLADAQTPIQSFGTRHGRFECYSHAKDNLLRSLYTK